MYTILEEAFPAGRNPAAIRQAPYINIDGCIKVANLAKERLPQMMKGITPYPIAELVRAFGLAVGNVDIRRSELRWAAAHDLGHWLLKHPNRPYWYLECEADVFARELLIPRSEVQQAWNGKGSVRKCAQLFGIPTEKVKWAISEYFSKARAFDCPVVRGLECASLKSIAECGRSCKPRLECLMATNMVTATVGSITHPRKDSLLYRTAE